MTFIWIIQRSKDALTAPDVAAIRTTLEPVCTVTVNMYPKAHVNAANAAPAVAQIVIATSSPCFVVAVCASE